MISEEAYLADFAGNLPGNDPPWLLDIRADALARFKASGLPLGIKLAPYLDITAFDCAARIVNQRKDRVRFVTTMNTLGNARIGKTVRKIR